MPDEKADQRPHSASDDSRDDGPGDTKDIRIAGCPVHVEYHANADGTWTLQGTIQCGVEDQRAVQVDVHVAGGLRPRGRIRPVEFDRGAERTPGRRRTPAGDPDLAPRPPDANPGDRGKKVAGESHPTFGMLELLAIDEMSDARLLTLGKLDQLRGHTLFGLGHDSLRKFRCVGELEPDVELHHVVPLDLNGVRLGLESDCAEHHYVDARRHVF